MAGELAHKTCGTELTQAEFEAIDLHLLNAQATGDIIYASSATQLSRLAKGTDGQYLKIGASIPAWATLTGVTIVRKTADESVTNSDTLQADNHLLLAIAASEVWLMEFHILALHSGTLTPDIKFGFAYPSGCSIYWGSLHQYWADVAVAGAGAGILTQTGTQNVDLTAGLDAVVGIVIRAIVINGATAGTLTLQWANNYAAADRTTTVKANSCLIAYKLA